MLVEGTYNCGLIANNIVQVYCIFQNLNSTSDIFFMEVDNHVKATKHVNAFILCCSFVLQEST